MLAACSSNSHVTIVDDAPESCKYLGDVWVWSRTQSETVILNELKSQSKNKFGANYLHCCWKESEETPALGRNNRTGETSPVGARVSGKAYLCNIKR